jgi:tRNA 2-thiouridine synthesizing protein A
MRQLVAAKTLKRSMLSASNQQTVMTKIEHGLTEHLLDASGLFCPEPVMMLHKKIREIGEGEILYLIATDPSTSRDVPKFCHFLGHELLSTSKDEKTFRYSIRKAVKA